MIFGKDIRKLKEPGLQPPASGFDIHKNKIGKTITKNNAQTI